VTLPAYSVRVSPRAKHPRLRMSAREGLVVIVPRGFDEERIGGVVESKRAWILRNQARLGEHSKFLEPQPNGRPPERITLRAIGQEWGVDYRPTRALTVTIVERAGQRLLVYGHVEDASATQAALRRWLSRKTREHVVPWLLRLADDHGLAVSHVAVRAQRTRWASCSARKTISLNARLLFLHEHLVRYVLLHELAHTVEMNHGQRFWALLRAFDREFEAADAELRSAWRLIPEWSRSADCRTRNMGLD
jgi:predicted metal-dependent hydrolase